MQLNFRATHVTYNLQKFALIRTEEIMPPLSLKQLSSFSQACHFVHQNMGHSVRLRVYDCSCFQLNRPEWANPEPQSLAMYITFSSLLNISAFRSKPKPGVLSTPLLLHMHELRPSHLVSWRDLADSTQHLGYYALIDHHILTYLCRFRSLIHPFFSEIDNNIHLKEQVSNQNTPIFIVVMLT